MIGSKEFCMEFVAFSMMGMDGDRAHFYLRPPVRLRTCPERFLSKHLLLLLLAPSARFRDSDPDSNRTYLASKHPWLCVCPTIVLCCPTIQRCASADVVVYRPACVFPCDSLTQSSKRCTLSRINQWQR